MTNCPEKCLAFIVTVAVVAGLIVISSGFARAENNVAPALALRQQVGDGSSAGSTPAAPAIGLGKLFADAADSLQKNLGKTAK